MTRVFSHGYIFYTENIGQLGVQVSAGNKVIKFWFRLRRGTTAYNNPSDDILVRQGEEAVGKAI